MGGPRLLRPGPQSDRLRARCRSARRLPVHGAGLRQLPGIGAYTSAAIAAIAFGEKVAAVDTNVARVIARLNGLKRPARGEIERLALAMMPDDRPGDFLQAMMDLGATICRPRLRAAAAVRCALVRRRFDRIGRVRSRTATAPGPAASLRRRLLDRARRPRLAGAAPGQWPAWRNGGASRRGIDRSASLGWPEPRRRPPCLHPFLARSVGGAALRSLWRGLVAAARRACRRRLADPLSSRRRAALNGKNAARAAA